MYSKKTLEKLATRAPGSSLTRGWILDGIGPARFGWAIRYPSGKLEFLARRKVDAIDFLTEQDVEHAKRSERDSAEWHSMRFTQAACKGVDALFCLLVNRRQKRHVEIH